MTTRNSGATAQTKTSKQKGRVVKFAPKASPLGRARIRQAVRAVAKARKG